MIKVERKPKVLVIGDLMIDSYLIGDCDRIALDAPVPIVDIKEEKDVLGGAGNVIRNLASLGAKVSVMSVVGSDDNARLLKHKLDEIETKSFLLEQKGRKTSKKTRIMSANQQIFRFDHESRNNISFDSVKKLFEKLQEKIKAYDVILLADYGKGVLTRDFTQKIISYANKNNVKTIVDPFGTDYSKYQGAYLIIPNKDEASVATDIEIENSDRLLDALKEIKNKFETHEAIVTLSEEGVALLKDNKLSVLPTVPLEVFDVTGSGDTLLASIGFALALDNDLVTSLEFANLATGVVLRKAGTATVSIDEIQSDQVYLDRKIIETNLSCQVK
ncbi:D-glycero-beta-D-manno-heptose-7-phosphate kinase [Halarcobacter sp.]|uniref:D-glycero-beta-D-manno-heptose-7-phosphate kinase n=1 Tax=Halarcobacter sp. TaxID=2321133 RepID=UPI002AABBD11|nr:D-glycero-beta-D-manno-heptose-7-phosphate kinase [Halarcobacter sp.]